MASLVLGLLIVLASLAGLVNAVGFVRQARSLERPGPHVPERDRPVVHTRYARLFGLSNATYGVAWYLVAGAAGILLMAGVDVPAWGWAALALLAAVTVALAVYLLWALVARLGTVCRGCVVGHLLNGFLFGAFLGLALVP